MRPFTFHSFALSFASFLVFCFLSIYFLELCFIGLLFSDRIVSHLPVGITYECAAKIMKDPRAKIMKTISYEGQEGAD